MFLDPVVDLLQNIVKKTTSIDEPTLVEGWEELIDAYNNGAVISGYLDHKVERGYMIRFGEVMGFAPRYRFDLCEYDDVPDIFLNKPLPFSILSIDSESNHLVVSRIDAVVEIYEDELAALGKNQIVSGVVSSVMEKLVTLYVNGLTCLVSRSELDWKPFYHPSDLVSVGDVIDVKLLKVVPTKAYLTASLKQLDNSCWQQFVDQYEIGSVVVVQISHVAEFGYFVTYDRQLSGILHWTELSWKPLGKQQLMVYNKGDWLEVKVSALDFNKQRISFSLKAMQPDPAERAFLEYNVGDEVIGVIRSRTDFGLFIEIAEDFNGLLHFSNLSWFSNSKSNLVNFRVGMSIRCKVIDIDKADGRIGLGLKQLYVNPFKTQPHSKNLNKPLGFPRLVRVAVSSYFQANCHNQVVALLSDLKHKMRQHIDLQLDNLFFDGTEIVRPDIMVVLISDDFFASEVYKTLQEYLSTIQEDVPMVLPVVADTITDDMREHFLGISRLPVDGKPLQQWRVKSAYWSTVNKALIKSVRHVAGLK